MQSEHPEFESEACARKVRRFAGPQPSIRPLTPVISSDIDLIWVYLPAFRGLAQTEAEKVLNDQERTRFKRYKHPGAAREFLICRYLLKGVLASHLNVDVQALNISQDSFGKPFIAMEPAPSCHFNLSHSHDFALIAISETSELGVDIERINPKRSWRELTQRYFSPEENKAVLQESTQSQQMIKFYRGWTRKEALLKASGKGITVDLKGFDISLDEEARLIESRLKGLNTQDWAFPRLPTIKDLFDFDLQLRQKAENYAFALVIHQSESNAAEKKLNNYMIHPNL